MKLAVTGKGGVGKTTVSALLACALRDQGRDVFAIDADPDSNLAACLGYRDADQIAPLVTLKDLIEERTGVKPGTTGGVFRLNPLVSDLPETYAVNIDGIKVLVAGAVKKGGSGCYCPENALVRALISHLLVERETALILDMEAGIEHLGRGTVAAVDALLIVVDPSSRSTETALRIKRLASDVGIRRVFCVGNKVDTEEDEAILAKALAGLDVLACLPYDSELRRADRSGGSAAEAGETIRRGVAELARKIEEALRTSEK